MTVLLLVKAISTLEIEQPLIHSDRVTSISSLDIRGKLTKQK